MSAGSPKPLTLARAFERLREELEYVQKTRGELFVCLTVNEAKKLLEAEEKRDD